MVIVRMDQRLLERVDSDFEITQQAGKLTLHLPAGKSLQEYLESGQLVLTQAAAAVINGKTADLSRTLKSGDVVQIVPQIAGG